MPVRRSQAEITWLYLQALEIFELFLGQVPCRYDEMYVLFHQSVEGINLICVFRCDMSVRIHGMEYGKLFLHDRAEALIAHQCHFA